MRPLLLTKSAPIQLASNLSTLNESIQASTTNINDEDQPLMRDPLNWSGYLSLLIMKYRA
jgi:hypothetical protein